MIEVKDVKNIVDIPNIENYLDEFFNLVLYERGDRTTIYKKRLENNHTLTIEMITPDSLIIGSIELAELITDYEIGYFQFTEHNDLGIPINCYVYRPKIKDSEKNY